MKPTMALSGENFVISEIQGFKPREGFNKTTAETLSLVVVKQKIGAVGRAGQSLFLLGPTQYFHWFWRVLWV